MKDFFKFKNLDSPDESAELRIYDEIGFWGTTAKDFHASLKSITGTKLKLYINTPGGNVVDGCAIYNMLRASGKEITVYVDGIAASIGSIIAMAGKTIKMPANTMMYIHDPLVNYASGDAEDLKKIISDLEKFGENLMSIYEARTGADRAKVKKWMKEDTLFTAKECLDNGLCDEVLPEAKAEALAVHDWKAFHPSIKIPSAGTTPPVGQNNKTKENNDMDLTQALAKIATLEGQVSGHSVAVENAKKQAQQEATTSAIKAEKDRKDAIAVFAAKHNKDGDLDAITVEALKGDLPLSDFKDKVLEVVAGRPTKAAAKKLPDEPAEGFEKEYAAAKTFAERQKVIKKYPAEAKAASRAS